MYRIVHGFPKYRVGRDGSYWSRKRAGWKRLRPVPTTNGYPRVTLYRKRDGQTERVQEYLHRLVLLTFVGPFPDGMETRHLDGNPRNNRLENLRFGTPAENEADKVRHGTNLRGEDSPNAKMSEADVRAIHDMRTRDGLSLAEIGRVLGVSKTTVTRALTGECWAHLVA